MRVFTSISQWGRTQGPVLPVCFVPLRKGLSLNLKLASWGLDELAIKLWESTCLHSPQCRVTRGPPGFDMGTGNLNSGSHT